MFGTLHLIYCTVTSCRTTSCFRHPSKTPKAISPNRLQDFSATCTKYTPDEATAKLWRAARRTVGA